MGTLIDNYFTGQTYAEVLSWRLVLGFGQAFSNPASYSLIADYFPESQRSQANGLFACGVYIGGGMASISISMATGLGWRTTNFLIAGAGFCLSALVGLFVCEPQDSMIKLKGVQERHRQKNFRQALMAIFGNRLVVLVFAASSLRYMGGYAIAGYLPTLYGTVFAAYDNQYSYINAYVVAAGGFLSSWIGGILADKWRAFEPRARMYLPACGCFGALPFMAICCLASDFYVSILLGLFTEYLVAECWFGPVVATMQSALEPDCRALAIACFTLIATFFGSLSSYIIGVIYDTMLSNGSPDTAVKWIILWSVIASYGCSGALFLYSSTIEQQAALVTHENRPLLEEEQSNLEGTPGRRKTDNSKRRGAE